MADPLLAGQVGLVTGGARGIGAAICRTLSGQGAAVCVADLDLDAAHALADELRHGGAEAMAVRVDVSDGGSFSSAAQATVGAFGDVTLLINNAGVVRPNMIYKMTDQEWDLVQDVVLRGAFNGARAVAPWFRVKPTAGGRRIVNIASVAYHGGIGGANYSAAKAGLLGLTRAVAHEWAQYGVTVNAVAPGYVDAGLSGTIPAVTRDQIVSRIPVGRPGTPEDVAVAVAFFCSPLAGYVTAQVLDVDGGMPDMRPR